MLMLLFRYGEMLVLYGNKYLVDQSKHDGTTCDNKIWKYNNNGHIECSSNIINSSIKKVIQKIMELHINYTMQKNDNTSSIYKKYNAESNQYLKMMAMILIWCQYWDIGQHYQMIYLEFYHALLRKH